MRVFELLARDFILPTREVVLPLPLLPTRCLLLLPGRSKLPFHGIAQFFRRSSLLPTLHTSVSTRYPISCVDIVGDLLFSLDIGIRQRFHGLYFEFCNGQSQNI